VSSATFHLRPATAGDLDRLFEIHRLAIRPYVEATWGWDEAWQAAYFREHFDPAIRQVICCGGRAIGFLDVVHRPDCVFLQNVEIEPEHQGRGVGTALVRRVLADAETEGVPARLQVLKVNERARMLYERLGFVQTGATETHIEMERRAS
jgi:ribosomal protein S18 acetylase RimI-like enzyme